MGRFLSGAYQDDQDDQENQSPNRLLAGSWQDDKDDQEHQNPIRRPPGSWHPNNLLIYFLLQLNQSQGSLYPSQASADQLPCAIVVSYILTTPYMLSLIDLYYIRLASPPPRAIKGERGIYLLTTIIPREWDILLYFRYLLCLGPSQALSKGHHSIKKR